MGVRLIKKQSIEDYVAVNVQSRSSFEVWMSLIKWTEWRKPQDIITSFNSADILGNESNRVVFNIGGNKYRLICKYQFWKGGACLFVIMDWKSCGI